MENYNSLFNEVDNEIPSKDNSYKSLFDEVDGITAPTNTEVNSLPAAFGGADSTPNPGNISSDISHNKTGALSSSITQGAKNVGEQLEQGVAGARQPIIGAAIAGSDIVDSTFGTNYAKGPRDSAKKIDNFISKYNEAHPDELIHPSTIGNLATYTALPLTRAVLADSAMIGATSFFNALGSNKDYDDAVIEGAASMALAGVATPILNKLFPMSGKLTKEAKLLLDLDRGRITEEQALKMLEGIPKKEQVLNLAEREDIFNKYIKKAIGDDNELITKYGERLESSKNKLEQLKSNKGDLEAVETRYTDMRNLVDKEMPDTIQLKFNPDELDEIVNIYKSDVSGTGTTLKAIQHDLSKDNLTLSSLLDIRENLNSILKKPSIKSAGRSVDNLVKLKGVIDKEIANATNGNPELTKTIQTAIDDFRVTKTNYEFGQIVDKHTKGNYAVDYQKVLNDIEEKGLYSNNVRNKAIPILKEFATKFKTDKFMGEAITPKGPHSASVLSVWSKIYTGILNFLSPIFDKTQARDLKITRAITSAIKKANPERPLDFVDKIFEIPAVQKAVKKQDFIKMIEYKPDAKTTGDVNLNKKYVTPEGKVLNKAEDASTNQLAKDTKKLLFSVREQWGKKADESVDKVMSHLDNIGFFKPEFKRYDTILKQNAKKLKVDDVNHNIQIVKNIVTNEAKQLIKTIEKTEGVKLSIEDAEKIVKHKLDTIFKDCK